MAGTPPLARMAPALKRRAVFGLPLCARTGILPADEATPPELAEEITPRGRLSQMLGVAARTL